jgi:hypothetical protein
MNRFFGSLAIVIGVLILGTVGLCTNWALGSTIRNPQWGIADLEMFDLALIFAGIPFVFGVVCIVGGWGRATRGVDVGKFSGRFLIGFGVLSAAMAGLFGFLWGYPIWQAGSRDDQDVLQFVTALPILVGLTCIIAGWLIGKGNRGNA